MKDKDGMNVAFLSLGGNLNRRLEIIKAATEAIDQNCGALLGRSSIYETEAWGSDSQKKYLNRVVKIKTNLSCEALLKKIAIIEKKAGRKRKGSQYSDRVLDIDILFFNDKIIRTSDLTVPHPRLHLRKFVLVPLVEIEKTLVHPTLKKTVGSLLKTCTDTLNVYIFKEVQFPRYVCIEGNIGSGKSTLALAIHKKWKAAILPEVFEDNGLLPLFYQNPKTYAFSLEYGFLMNRFQEINNLLKSNESKIISDYSFYKCLYFAKVNLPAKEFSIFKKHFKTLLKLLPKPDLIVYLNTNTDLLLANIKKRNRPYEKSMKASYLSLIGQQYKLGFKELKKVKKLVIPVISYHEGLEAELINKVENYIEQTFGYQVQKT